MFLLLLEKLTWCARIINSWQISMNKQAASTEIKIDIKISNVYIHALH